MRRGEKISELGVGNNLERRHEAKVALGGKPGSLVVVLLRYKYIRMDEGSRCLELAQ